MHKVTNYKPVKFGKDIDSDVVLYPKDAISKVAEPLLLQKNHMLYSSKVQFLPDEIENIPKSCIFT